MSSVVIWTVMFSTVTVISILLTGSRGLISGEIGMARMVRIVFDWRFILGAGFAFLARLCFIMVNNSLLKIPTLAASSTTITTFITSIALVFVVVANHFVLQERISITQGVGMFVMFIGMALLTAR